MHKETGIEQAVKKFDGSPTKLANAVGGAVLRQHIEHWLKVGRVPAERAPELERATGIPCEILCPDVAWDVVRGTSVVQQPPAEQGV